MADAAPEKTDTLPPDSLRPAPAFVPAPTGVWRTVSPAGFLAAAVADALEHRRHIVLLPFGLIAGVLLYLAASFEPAPAASISLASLLILAAILARLRRAQAAMRWLTLAAAIAGGFALPSLHAALGGTAMLGSATVAVLEGRVAERRQSGPDRQTIFLDLLASDATGRLAGLRQVRLTVDGAAPILPDSTLTVRARLFEVPGPVAPGAYDPQIHEYFTGVGAYATALDPPDVTPGSGSFTALIAGVRALIEARIEAHLSGSAAAFAVALTIGEQGAISEADRRAMARAGLAHVISISGLHLSLVAGLAFLALRLLMAIGPTGDRLPVKAIAAFVAILVALGYLLISAASIATIRSTIMLVLIFAAIIAGRRALTMRNVVLAALVIIAFSPLEVLRPGFQLSFVAVVALIGFYEGLGLRPRRDGGSRPALLRYAGGLALTSIIAGIATAPYAAFHFQQFAPLGILGNLLVVPIVGFLILPAALVGVFLIPLGLEGPFFSLMGTGIEAMLAIAYWVASLSGPLTVTPEVTPLALGVVSIGVAWFAFLRTRARFIGPAAGLGFFMLFGWQAPPDLIVSDSSQAVAIRTVDGLRLVGSNRASFAVEAWSDRFGADLAGFDATGAYDAYGCIAEGAGGWRLAVERSFAAAAEDCGRVEVMIAREEAPAPCHAAGIVITQQDLDRHGVTTLTRDPAGALLIRTAFDDIERPWRAGRRD